MARKISHVFGLFPPIVSTLQAHGCKVEKCLDHEGTLKVPVKSFVLDWPGESNYGLGLVRTPSGAYIMWGQYPTGCVLHFVGPAPWPDDQMLIHEIQKMNKLEDDRSRWLTELIRMRMFRLMVGQKGGVDELMCEMALRAQRRTLN